MKSTLTDQGPRKRKKQQAERLYRAVFSRQQRKLALRNKLREFDIVEFGNFIFATLLRKEDWRTEKEPDWDEFVYARNIEEAIAKFTKIARSKMLPKRKIFTGQHDHNHAIFEFPVCPKMKVVQSAYICFHPKDQDKCVIYTRDEERRDLDFPFDCPIIAVLNSYNTIGGDRSNVKHIDKTFRPTHTKYYVAI